MKYEKKEVKRVAVLSYNGEVKKITTSQVRFLKLKNLNIIRS